ncbi:MAG: hypothetical protein H6677_04405 [Candidatus Obscuribacterales bacterium]|nr:hypothetical protein [Cyanobacteria bacterium HKST-UBA01]MCB9467498.1 hypothetical protein [Candidatus Obscuribacterales bacterium]
MNFWGFIGTLRKFGNFVVGLFPVLGIVAEYIGKQFAKIGKNPTVAKRWKAFAETDRGEALIKAFQRFYWRDYASDRLELDKLPAHTVPSLRIIFILSMALCLLTPLAVAGVFPEASMTMLSGETGSAAYWSVALWLLSTAVAWGAALAGAGISNRPLSVCLNVLYTTSFGMVALLGGRSVFNILLPMGAFIAHFLTERSLSKPGARDILKGLVSAAIVGFPAGIYVLALTPLHAINMGNTVLFGPIYGAIICLLLGFVARFKKAEESNVSNRVWLLSVLNTVFLITLVARGGWSEFAGYLLSNISLFNGYLWPVWYFIGIGIIFKLLKNSKIFAKAIKESLPGKAFTPIVFLIIVLGTVVTWSESVIRVYDVNSSYRAIIDFVTAPFFNLYTWSKEWLWAKADWSQTAKTMRWVFAGELVAMLWMAAKRRLDSENMASLLYFTILSGFLIYEYNFQQFSFIRTPSHSFILLGFFSVWLLWLFHRVGLKMSLETSPLFPSAGRLPIYGAILLFCLCEIHARSALKDFNIMNKIFLIMFRGIIDVGLPYFLYVFATRRFKELPLKLSTIFGIFCLGAVLTLPFTVLEKLALCGWSPTKLNELVSTQNTLLTEYGMANLPWLQFPLSWFFLKTAMFTGALVLVTQYVLKKTDAAKSGRLPSAIIFSTLAFTSGFSSFIKTSVDLPLPNEVKALLLPTVIELNLNANVLAIYLSYWIPALLFCFVLAWAEHRSALRWVVASAVAAGSFFVFNYFWPSHEAFLRSSEILKDCGVFFFGLLTYLLVIAIRRIEARNTIEPEAVEEQEQEQELELESVSVSEPEPELEPESVSEPELESEPKPESESESETALLAPLISNRQIHALAAVFFVGIIWHGYGLVEPGRLLSHKAPVLGRDIVIPARWGKNLQTDSTKHAFFNIVHSGGFISSVVWSMRPTPPGGNAAILADLDKESKAAPAIANLEIYHKANWSKHYPGATAYYFSMELVTPKFRVPRSGITVMMPRTDGKTEILTELGEPHEFEVYEWDVVRMVRAAAADSKIAGKRPDIVDLLKLSVQPQ